jgi:hypothetical protein
VALAPDRHRAALAEGASGVGRSPDGAPQARNPGTVAQVAKAVPHCAPLHAGYAGACTLTVPGRGSTVGGTGPPAGAGRE